MESWTIRRLLDTAAGYLKEKGSPSARLDAELLLADTLHLDRIHLYTQHDRPLTSEEVSVYRTLIARRAAHEPVAYIRGRAYFRHLTLEVGPAVLIPRPETEELVELALDTLRRRPPWGDLPDAERPVGPARGSGASSAARGASSNVRGASDLPLVADTGSLASGVPLVADVGTGSGAIALSVAQEAELRVLAVDSSAEALAVAARNTRALGLADRVVLREGDLLAGLSDSSLAAVVSNPPYVRSGDIPALAPDIRLFEPVAALDGGPDGLDVYRRLAPDAARALRPGGALLIEVGEDQAGAVSGIARAAGFALVSVHKDLSRKERMVLAVLPGAPALRAEELGPAEAAALRSALGAGAVIGVPTDTVYGLAARWDLAAGIRNLFAAKQRPPEQPVAVVFPSVEGVTAALPDLEPTAARVLAALLPGPYTLIVATSVPRPELVGTPDSLGIRVPDHPALLRLLVAIDVPLALTSANLSGRPAAATADQVDPHVLAHCSVAVASEGLSEGDSRPVGVASTVVDIRPLADGGEPVLLREGAVPRETVLGLIRASA